MARRINTESGPFIFDMMEDSCSSTTDEGDNEERNSASQPATQVSSIPGGTTDALDSSNGGKSLGIPGSQVHCNLSLTDENGVQENMALPGGQRKRQKYDMDDECASSSKQPKTHERPRTPVLFIKSTESKDEDDTLVESNSIDNQLVEGSISSQKTEVYDDGWVEDDDIQRSLTVSSVPSQKEDSIDDGSSGDKNGTSNSTLVDAPGRHNNVAVLNDALRISELLEGVDFERIYKKVQQLQALPNRLQLATEELLEEIEKDTILISDKEPSSGIPAEKPAPSTESLANYKEICSLSSPSIGNGETSQGNLMGVVNNSTRPAEGFQNSSSHDKDGTGKPSLQPIKSVKADAEHIASFLGMSDTDKIYKKVCEQRSKPNRIELVANQFLEEQNIRASGRDMMVEDLVNASKTPKNFTGPVESVQPEANRGVLVHTDSDLARDPLFKDTQTLAKIFPDKDENEIFAHLEVYHDRPNRVELVMEEFLHVDRYSQDSQENMAGNDTTDAATEPWTGQPLDSGRKRIEDILDKLRENVLALNEIFPDCDPDYIVQQLQLHSNDPNCLSLISADLFSNRTYPKLKDRLEKEKNERERERLQNLSVNLQDFIEMFPDPLTHFYDETKEVSRAYKQHGQIQLHNDFLLITVKYIEEVWKRHSFHYTPSLRALTLDLANMMGSLSKRLCHRPRAMEDDWPSEPDDYFFRELFFSKHEEQIQDYIQKKQEEKAERLRNARETGQLHECGCCFEDEVLFEDMQACPDGHLFCSECVRRSVEAAISEGKVKFSCLQGECPTDFTLQTLQAVLAASRFSLVLRKLQEEELRNADIPDLVVCPFCPYATVMPDPNDKLLRCQNPECLKESCRLCGELNHIPLRCEEVEKDSETKMRIYIENKMAEAMLRTCWKCKKRFYKTTGCNKMTCVCGASMCYVCREPIKDYSHFAVGGRCSKENNMVLLHEKEVVRAAKKAKRDYRRAHPEATNIQLRHNPLTTVPQAGGAFDVDDDGDDRFR